MRAGRKREMVHRYTRECTRELSLVCTRTLSHVCTRALSLVTHACVCARAVSRALARLSHLTPTLLRRPVRSRVAHSWRTLGAHAQWLLKSLASAAAPWGLMRVQRDSSRPKRAAPSACNNEAAAPPMRASLSPASSRVAPRACGAGARAGRALPPSSGVCPGFKN